MVNFAEHDYWQDRAKKAEAEVNRLKKRLSEAGGWEDKNGIVVIGADAVKCDDHNLIYTANNIYGKMRGYYYSIGLCKCGLPLQKNWNGHISCINCEEGE